MTTMIPAPLSWIVYTLFSPNTPGTLTILRCPSLQSIFFGSRRGNISPPTLPKCLLWSSLGHTLPKCSSPWINSTLFGHKVPGTSAVLPYFPSEGAFLHLERNVSTPIPPLVWYMVFLLAQDFHDIFPLDSLCFIWSWYFRQSHRSVSPRRDFPPIWGIVLYISAAYASTLGPMATETQQNIQSIFPSIHETSLWP